MAVRFFSIFLECVNLSIFWPSKNCFIPRRRPIINQLKAWFTVTETSFETPFPSTSAILRFSIFADLFSSINETIPSEFTFESRGMTKKPREEDSGARAGARPSSEWGCALHTCALPSFTHQLLKKHALTSSYWQRATGKHMDESCYISLRCTECFFQTYTPSFSLSVRGQICIYVFILFYYVFRKMYLRRSHRIQLVLLFRVGQWFSNEYPQPCTCCMSPSSITPDSTHQLISADCKTGGCFSILICASSFPFLASQLHPLRMRGKDARKKTRRGGTESSEIIYPQSLPLASLQSSPAAQNGYGLILLNFVF